MSSVLQSPRPRISETAQLPSVSIKPLEFGHWMTALAQPRPSAEVRFLAHTTRSLDRSSRPASGRVYPFAKPSTNGRYLRKPDGFSHLRQADVGGCNRGRRSWAVRALREERQKAWNCARSSELRTDRQAPDAMPTPHRGELNRGIRPCLLLCSRLGLVRPEVTATRCVFYTFGAREIAMV